MIDKSGGLSNKSIIMPPEHERDWAEYRKIIAGPRLIDDDFMSIAFNNDNELTAFVLRIILEKDDLIVTKVRTQAESKSATNSAADSPSLKSSPSRKPSPPDPQRRIAALLFLLKIENRLHFFELTNPSRDDIIIVIKEKLI